MKIHYQKLRLILGDQLNAKHSWFQEKCEDTLYVVAELNQELTYVKHHIQKIAAFFAAMESFACALERAGYHTLYLTLDETHLYSDLPELLSALIAKYQIQQFEYQLPDEFRLRAQLSSFANSLTIESKVYESEHFYLADSTLSQYFKYGKRHRMEHFYRKLRVQFDVLMQGDSPAGDQWNFDQQNRQKLKQKDYERLPEAKLFDNNIEHILKRLARHNVLTIGSTTNTLFWPINRRQAIDLLEHFCQHCLPYFGTYQDAMVHSEDLTLHNKHWSLFHCRLSFAMNSKMLSPQHVINAAIKAYETNTNAISLAQIEGFVRQILGWREFIRGMYWANMPDYQKLNALSASRPLPHWFWNANTKMNCLQHAITQSLDYAYAHHIQRLMITGNFCLITGIDPNDVDAWYLGIYIDAVEWVEMPNTRGMSQFADGGLVGSKAYAASGNYVNKMSNYCQHCTYKASEITEQNACPLNALYWRFMVKHESAFTTNPRNRVVYANWHKKPEPIKHAILQKAEQLLIHIESL